MALRGRKHFAAFEKRTPGLLRALDTNERNERKENLKEMKENERKEKERKEKESETKRKKRKMNGRKEKEDSPLISGVTDHTVSQSDKHEVREVDFLQENLQISEEFSAGLPGSSDL